MKKKTFISGIAVGIVLTLLTLVVNAEPLDTAIRTVVANNRTPIAIEVTSTNPLLIEFDASETLQDIAFGGSEKWRDSWEIVKRGSRLFVKLRTKHDKVQRSLIVTSAANSYVFFLIPKEADKALTFVSKLIVQFEKPTPPASSVSSFAGAKQFTEQITLPIIDTTKQPVFLKRNYAYTLQIVSETVDIRPRSVWDDGRFTRFIFPNNISIPAIYRTVPNSGEEALVNWHLEGDTVVVHGISPAWNLRMGKSVIGVFNEKYDPVGIETPNKTVTNEVREIIQ